MMKKAVVTGFINYEEKLNKEVFLGALARLKQEKKQRQLNAYVKIYYTGVEMVPFARKVKNLTQVKLNIVELDEGLFYRVPNQSTLMPFKELPLNLVDKIELWVDSSQEIRKTLTDEERRENYYKRINQLRSASFCTLSELKKAFEAHSKVEVLDLKTILPEYYYEMFLVNLNGGEDFEMKYGYIDITAEYVAGKWNISVEIIDDAQDLEQIYQMINEEVAICMAIN